MTKSRGGIVDIFRLSLDENWNLQLLLNSGLIALVGITGFAFLLVSNRFQTWRRGYFEIDEALIGIGNQKVKIRPNYEDLQIAYQLWIELTTRKIGLPLDEENDLIVEIFDSWYAFFGIARELIKEIPVPKLRSQESTQHIVRISVTVLNMELRPLLTRWHARYRRWWEYAFKDETIADLSPQALQRQFPEYDQLMADMTKVNERLVAYTGMLEGLIHS